MASEYTEWKSKKGKWKTYHLNDEGGVTQEGFETSGDCPSNEQILYRYVDYLDAAASSAAKGAKANSKPVLNVSCYNIKNFVAQECGNHKSSFQVKQIIKGFNESIPAKQRVFVLPTGPMGASSKSREYRKRVSEWLITKKSHLSGKTFDT